MVLVRGRGARSRGHLVISVITRARSHSPCIPDTIRPPAQFLETRCVSPLLRFTNVAESRRKHQPETFMKVILIQSPCPSEEHWPHYPLDPPAQQVLHPAARPVVGRTAARAAELLPRSRGHEEIEVWMFSKFSKFSTQDPWAGKLVLLTNVNSALYKTSLSSPTQWVIH